MPALKQVGQIRHRRQFGLTELVRIKLGSIRYRLWKIAELEAGMDY